MKKLKAGKSLEDNQISEEIRRCLDRGAYERLRKISILACRRKKYQVTGGMVKYWPKKIQNKL